MADDPAKPPETSMVLDQSEIDRLLTQQAGPAKQQVFQSVASRHFVEGNVRIENYDFRNPVFLTEVELRRLRLLHEDFIRYLAARLSLFLRMELGLKMSKLTTLTYAKFTDSLPSPTHLCLFKVEPLLGVGILDVNPRLALTIADRMLGGRGHSVKLERYLTEIEIALLEDIITIILEEWCAQWRNEQELHPVILGHENNGRFLQTSPKDAIVLALSLEASFGDCSEQIQIGIPYYTIEPIVRKMQSRRQKDNAAASVEKRSEWQPAYDHINVPVRGEWEACELNLREIVHLRVGDVIELPTTLFEDTRVLLNGAPKFVGKVGLEADHVAIQITRRVNPQNQTPHVSTDGRKKP
jgi:flagellar motor switch protein FliM